MKNIVHQALEDGQGISQAEMHYHEFIVAFVCQTVLGMFSTTTLLALRSNFKKYVALTSPQ